MLGNTAEDCETCNEFALHKDKYEAARAMYRADKEISSEDTRYLSVDLQKVILLPRLPGYKSAIFTPRLITFNQTFAPLGGKKSSSRRPLGVIWHAATSGRKAEDITSTFHLRKSCSITGIVNTQCFGVTTAQARTKITHFIRFWLHMSTCPDKS